MCFVLIVSGCAYFNTFYNAKQYYKAAEKIRLEKFGQSLPSNGTEAYMNAIKKSMLVIENYPESRFRKPAIILMAKSRFHIREYNRAQQLFFQIKDEYPEEKAEADYWLSLCKWKKGKIQPAINELSEQLGKTNDDAINAQIYFSLADIQLEINENKKAMEYLISGAELTKNPNDRAEIYFRIADIATLAKNYELAIKANKKEIKYSLTKNRIEEANLNLVKIYRSQERWNEVSDLIKKLLATESFNGIWGELELELAKLDIAIGKLESAVSRLNGVAADYARTEISAEAYFNLAEISLFTDFNFEDALKSYNQVPKESGKSVFKNSAQMRGKEIKSYQASLSAIASIFEVQTTSDTSVADSLEITQKDPFADPNYAPALYNLGELWAFHFGQPDSALQYFYEIVDSLEKSQWTPKAMFTLVYLLKESENDAHADPIKEKILSDYPKSEFATGIRTMYGLNQEVDPNHTQLLKAESFMRSNVSEAMNTYREIIQSDSTTEVGLKAAYSLAHYYDVSLVEPDSAIKYYQWMGNHFPTSDSYNNAKVRLQMITQLVESMKQDTVATDERD